MVEEMIKYKIKKNKDLDKINLYKRQIKINYVSCNPIKKYVTNGGVSFKNSYWFDMFQKI